MLVFSETLIEGDGVYTWRIKTRLLLTMTSEHVSGVWAAKKSRSALQPISVTPAPFPLRDLPATLRQLHPIFGSLRSDNKIQNFNPELTLGKLITSHNLTMPV